MTAMANHVRPRSRAHVGQSMLVAVLLAWVATPGTALAQPVTRDFERKAPAVGELMPEARVYDRDGGEPQLRELLQAHYTVLILGCLT